MMRFPLERGDGPGETAPGGRQGDWRRRAIWRTVLDPDTLMERGATEVSRARRYSRHLAVIVVDLRGAAEQQPVATTVTHALRRWDLAGFWYEDQPTIVAVLPETDLKGANGFIRRLSGMISHTPMASAALPADGSTLTTLVETARRRAALPLKMVG